MKKNVKITLLLCLGLVLMFGGAMADMGNNSTQDAPSADTPSNNSINETDDVDDAAADGNETDDASDGNETDDASDGNETDDASNGNETDDASDGNETDDASDGNETDDASNGNETDDASDGNETEDASDGNETDDAADGNETDGAADGNETDNNVTDELTDELFSEGEEVDDESDDIPPFEGAVGPEHALYGLKIAFGNINETFTYNSSERLGLQVSRARHRIAEARAEMDKGNSNGAGVALGHYKKMMDNIDVNVNGSDINSTDLVKASEKMSKHQKALMLMQKKAQGKDVEGLMDALNGSQKLEEKFTHKLEKKIQKGVKGPNLLDNDSNTTSDASKGKKPDRNQRGNNKGNK